MSEQAPWQWPEERWRGIVGRVRAGRPLRPKGWPGALRGGVVPDHEREGSESIGRVQAIQRRQGDRA
jgi:hypothetical protein